MTLYCECETPVMDVRWDAGCRRCGRPVDFSPSPPAHDGLGRERTDWRFLGWLGALVAGLAVAAALTVADARAAAAPTQGELFAAGRPACERVYPAPPAAFTYVGAYGWTRWYTKPVGLDYLRCLAGERGRPS